MKFLSLLKVVLTIFGALRKIDFNKAIEIAKAIRDLLASMKDGDATQIANNADRVVAVAMEHAGQK